MINKTTFSTLKGAIATSQELLTNYALSDELLGDLTTAFGSEYNRDAAEDLVKQWQTGDFDSFPEIEIRDSAEINGANGAYSTDTNKIYIAQEYLLGNANNINAVSDLVIEEYGHYVDAQINSIDAAGDEGDIFSSLVRGESFTDGELQELKLENDQAIVTIDGSEIAIEQQTSSTFSSPKLGLKDFAFGAGGWSSFDKYPRSVGDINGDGKADLIGFGQSGVFTALSEFNLIRGTENDDTLTVPNNSNYILEGLGGADILNGGDGNDILDGGAGNYIDELYGGAGNDILKSGVGRDILDGGAGIDTVDFSQAGEGYLIDLPNQNSNGKELISIENIIGSRFDDTIIGDNNNNKLEGGEGKDTLDGGAGDDTLAGGTGTNQLSGGEGKDIFVTESGGIQKIQAFERGVDKIDMAGVGVNQIAFDFKSDPGATIIKVKGTERARVIGSMVDSSSLINTSNDINPDPLSPQQLQLRQEENIQEEHTKFP